MSDWDFKDLGDLEKLGGKVQDIIDDAINSKNYRKLNQTISQAVNSTVRQYEQAKKRTGETIRDADQRMWKEEQERKHRENERMRQAWKDNEVRKRNQTYGNRYSQKQTVQNAPQEVLQPWEARPDIYRPLTGEKVKNILYTVFGGILTGTMSVSLLTVVALQALIETSSMLVNGFMTLGLGVGAALLVNGCVGLGRIGRFKKYVKALGTHTYCDFPQLARAAGKPVKFVKREIKSMVERGWFLEGHVDAQETCLITTNDTYRQYENTRQNLEQQKAEQQLVQKKAEEAAQKAKEAERKAQEARRKISPEVQEILDKGNEYILEIRRCNDAIPGEEISEKIDKIEQIVRQIFKRAEQHPEVISDLKRMMNYYLPTTVKLLRAYEEMDAQPVQGENIQNSKKEIEDTLDTLNDAFGKLLDSIFQDTAWDVSSDISVLHTILAQEGLAGDDFKINNQGK